MRLLFTFRFVRRAPARVDACRHWRTDTQIVPVADVLDAVVVLDLNDVITIDELAADANQKYLTVFDRPRMTTEFCSCARTYTHVHLCGLFATLHALERKCQIL